MRAFFAILVDSYRESVDNRIFLFLMVLCAIFVLLILLVGFEDMTAEDAVANLARRMEDTFSSPFPMSPLGQEVKTEGPAPVLVGIEKILGDEQQVLRAKFRHEDPSLFRYKAKEIKGYPGTEQELEGESGLRIFLMQEFGFAGFRGPRGSPGPLVKNGAEPNEFVVIARPRRSFEMAGGQQLTILFGVWKIPLSGITGKQFVQIVQVFLSRFIGGWAGVIVAVLMTAWFVPNMLKKGTVDLLLSKPVSRVNVVVAKYVGGLSFVFFNAVVLVGGSWLAFAVKSGYWHPGYLASVLTITFLFAILYSVSVLAGFLWQNSILSIVVTIVFWGLCFLVDMAHSLVNRSSMLSGVPKTAKQIVKAVHYVLPNTSDMGKLGEYFMVKGSENSELVKAVQVEMYEKYDFAGSFATSFVFIAVMLGLAYLVFRRKDY